MIAVMTAAEIEIEIDDITDTMMTGIETENVNVAVVGVVLGIRTTAEDDLLRGLEVDMVEEKRNTTGTVGQNANIRQQVLSTARIAVITSVDLEL